jgi:hypothetical protein
MNRLAIVLGIALLPLSACGEGARDSAGPNPTATVTVTATPAPTSTAPTTPPPQPSWPTDDVTVPPTGAVPPVPVLTAIRVGAHPEGGFDRVAFEFDGLPGYRIGYRDKIVYDGSGEPVDLDGTAFLQLVFNPAQAHDEQGRPSLVPVPNKPILVGYPALVAYVLNGDFEGYVSVALGLTAKVGFDVQHYRQTDGRYVIYVDVARP